ncbi:hypothetical protein KUCAC02_032590, partial [Chaenocephalus aceratus]
KVGVRTAKLPDQREAAVLLPDGDDSGRQREIPPPRLSAGLLSRPEGGRRRRLQPAADPDQRPAEEVTCLRSISARAESSQPISQRRCDIERQHQDDEAGSVGGGKGDGGTWEVEGCGGGGWGGERGRRLLGIGRKRFLSGVALSALGASVLLLLRMNRTIGWLTAEVDASW